MAMQRVWLLVGGAVLSACSFDGGGVGAGPAPDGIDAGERSDAGPPGPDAAPPPPPPSSARVWITRADGSRLLAQAPDVAFGDRDAALTTIEIDPGTAYQTMVGFGASLTESSAHVIATELPLSQRTALLRRLFDPVSGIGLGVLRQPIGATDFSLGNYSYDETAPDLADFSVARDRQGVLPLLREIRAINPGLVLMASPWSPPAWMKTSGSMIGGSLRPDRYPAFAEYLARFVEAYQAEGIPVAALTLQNEPHYTPAGYPGMYMGAEEQGLVIARHLTPALAARGLSPRIFVWDHNWDEPDYPLALLDDPAVEPLVAGTGFHCYYGEPAAQSQVHDAHPDKDIWITECSGGTWRGGFADSLRYDVQTLLIASIRNWAQAIIKWNLVLDDGAGPTNGGCTICRGTARVDRSSGAVALEAEFYALGHLSRFVRSGARRIESTHVPDGLETVAFENLDRGVVVLVLNAGQDEQHFQIAIGDRALPYTLPAGAVATVSWGSGGSLDRSSWRATASTSEFRQTPDLALDGDLATRWSSGVDQYPDQWLAIDLGAARTFRAITLDTGVSTGDYPRRYEVQLSADGVTWGPAIASGAGDSELFTIAVPETTARHLRVRQTATADRWWSIHELTLHE
jgi:glucosylceramidase